MKLKKAMRGVPNGAIYPVDYAKGDDCPEELVEAARVLGCLPVSGGNRPNDKDNGTDDAPQIDAAKPETEPSPEPEIPSQAAAPQETK